MALGPILTGWISDFFGESPSCDEACALRRTSGHAAFCQGRNGYGSTPMTTMFRGMNIHLPTILMFIRGTGFWHTAKWWFNMIDFEMLFFGKISGVRSEILECLTVCPSKYGSFTYHLWNLYHQNDSSFAGKEKALKIVVMHKIAKETWRWKQQGHGPKCFKFATWVLPILPRSAQICFLVSKLQVLPTHVGTCWLHVYYYSDAIDPDNCQMQSLPASSESQGYRPTSPLLAAD